VYRISFEVVTFLLQIISQKDEHCWVGELNGLRGKLLLKCKGMKDFQSWLFEISPVFDARLWE